MRAVLQRVRNAHVEVNGVISGEIGPGILLLLAVAKGDTQTDADYLAGKVLNLRIFDDADGKLNLSVTDTGGSVLIVSQFTLYGDCSKGRRPSYDRAAAPADARGLYEYFVTKVTSSGINVATGVFQATMKVYLENDGPVTLICESKD